MGKKSFISGNPALQFISDPAEVPAAPEETTEKTAPQISTNEQPPEGYKMNPLYIEKKTKRLQLLMQPSLFEKIKEAADENGTSVNDLIHKTLEERFR